MAAPVPEEAILRLTAILDQRLRYFGHLATLIIPLEVADVLVDQTWLFIFFVTVFEDLGVFSNLHIELIIAFRRIFGGFSTDLKIDLPCVLDSQRLACEVVDLSWLHREAL